MIIDQLPLLGGDVQGTDEFPIERGTTTYKTTQAALVKTATDAAASAQAAADEANAKGLPPGGTAGQVLTKADSSNYSASWEDPSGGGDVTADMLGIVINGNSTPVGASIGQYVIVKDSTITGITDGLYTAAQAIPANTAIDATYLTAVSDGAINDLIAAKPVTVTTPSGVTFTGNAVQIGKIVYVSGFAHNASDLPADATILTLSKPNKSGGTYFVVVQGDNGEVRNMYLGNNTANLCVNVLLWQPSYYVFNFCYITE